MKPYLALVAIICGIAVGDARSQEPEDQLPPLPAGKQWKLVWHDSFEGETLDASKWGIPEGPRRDGWWSRDAISLDGKGHLVLHTFKDGDRYVDGCVRTRDKFEHAKGYFVARVKFHSQVGHWPAFWLYDHAVNNVGNGARDGAEIDIMEKPWIDSRLFHAIHWDGGGKTHRGKGKEVKVEGVMEGWHTFALWWNDEEYVFYVDGKVTWRTDAGGICEEPLYIKLSDEVGDWAGDIADAKLPDRFMVDYVRVYDVEEVPAEAPSSLR